jgi:hypothetical protein
MVRSVAAFRRCCPAAVPYVHGEHELSIGMRAEAAVGEKVRKIGRKLAVRQGFEPWIQLLGRITV